MSKLKIKLYTPHPAQKKLHDSNSRFIVACCGRRFGKTMMAINELVKYLWENPFNKGYWVAPVYRQCRLAYTSINKNFKNIIFNSTQNPMEIIFENGSLIKFVSTESYENIRGDNANIMVVDEAALVQEEAWNNVLRPMLSDTSGRAILISTPKSKNWFFRLFARGEDDSYENYESFVFPTSANPFIAESELIEVKQTVPEDIWKQEYEAEFLEDGGAVFKNVRGCVDYRLELIKEPVSGREYICGIDLAKHSDYTCVITLDVKDMKVVRLDRFNRIDYSIQAIKIKEVASKYNNAKIIMDCTGVGDPIMEMLVNMPYGLGEY